MQCFLLFKHLLFIFTKPKSTLHIWEQLTNGLTFLWRLIIHFQIFNKWLWAQGPMDETGLLPLRSQGHLLMKNPGQGITWKSTVRGTLLKEVIGIGAWLGDKGWEWCTRQGQEQDRIQRGRKTCIQQRWYRQAVLQCYVECYVRLTGVGVELVVIAYSEWYQIQDL